MFCLFLEALSSISVGLGVEEEYVTRKTLNVLVRILRICHLIMSNRCLLNCIQLLSHMNTLPI